MPITLGCSDERPDRLFRVVMLAPDGREYEACPGVYERERALEIATGMQNECPALPGAPVYYAVPATLANGNSRREPRSSGGD